VTLKCKEIYYTKEFYFKT